MDEPVSQRAILADHLYQKVREIYGCMESKADVINKITGMLLEGSTDFIYKMLTDEGCLKKNVGLAEEYVMQNRDSDLMRHDNERCDQANDNSGDSINPQHGSPAVEELLYDKVHQLNPSLAPQITGMMLELDKEILLEVLHNQHKFQRLYQRARSCLKPEEMSSQRNQNINADITDRFSLEIFKYAEKFCKEEAAKITGMILELDPKTLEQLLGDPASLETAMKKAYSALLDSDIP